MKRVFLLAVIVLITACSETPKIDYPYEFIDSKTETAGAYENKMFLYEIPESVNIDTLKMFCSEMKTEFKTGAFHYLVFFDSKENAKFPSNPFTAVYGGDEDLMLHIKAYYEYNVINGYSKLYVYDENAYESPSNTIEIN